MIDEFPYLESAAPALPSILQALIDHEFRESRMKLVLSGSHITAMKRLEDAAGFVPGYDALDRIRAFAIFGSVPGHLALLDPDKDLATNVQRELLDPAARLFDEAQHVLDAFLRDAEVYYSIIEAIAAGERTWAGIASRVGKGSGVHYALFSGRATADKIVREKAEAGEVLFFGPRDLFP